MAGSTTDISIPPHKHGLRSILSMSDTISQMVLGDVNKLPSWAASIKDGIFKTSENFLVDICKIEEQILSNRNTITLNYGSICGFRPNGSENDGFGMVKIAPDSGIINTNGVLAADFSALQPKLVDYLSTGDITTANIKTIAGYSILRTKDDSTSIPVVTSEALEAALEELRADTEYTTTSIQERLNNIDRELVEFQTTVSELEKYIINILNEIQMMTGGGTSGSLINSFSASTTGISGLSSGSGGLVVCAKETPITDTCDDIILYPGRNYYRKIITSSLDSCVDSDAEYWFQFDTTRINTIQQEYMVVKFDLDLEVEDKSYIPATSRWPWEWIGTAPSLSGDITNIIIEIRGYYKCQTWFWFGKHIHTYNKVCDDTEPPVSGDSDDPTD